jgi:IS30 family transposase
MARSLGRAPSTVSREIQRNGGHRRYRASLADQAAWERAKRPKPCKLAINHALARLVAKKLQQLWSPDQIAGWLKCTYPDNEGNQVSHETIYKSLFIQARGALKKELLQHLGNKRGMRRPRHKNLKEAGLGQITSTVPIRERPASVEHQAVAGHWEGDLLMGSNNSYIATLVEWHTRYVILAKVPSKDTETVSPDQARSQATQRTLQITDLGSRQGDG